MIDSAKLYDTYCEEVLPVDRSQQGAMAFAVEAMAAAAECSSAGSVQLQARPAEGGEWIDIYPAQLQWMAKEGHDVRAVESEFTDAQSARLTDATRDQIAAIIKKKVDYFLHDEQGPLDAADAILALSTPPQPALGYLRDAAEWCAIEREKIGAVDGYDYRSGEEYGLRRAEIELLHRAKSVTPAQPQAAWQPIETAPKDGTHILVDLPWLPYPKILFWAAYANEWRCPASEDRTGPYLPTHWQPLPAPLSRPQRGDD